MQRFMSGFCEQLSASENIDMQVFRLVFRVGILGCPIGPILGCPHGPEYSGVLEMVLRCK